MYREEQRMILKRRSQFCVLRHLYILPVEPRKGGDGSYTKATGCEEPSDDENHGDQGWDQDRAEYNKQRSGYSE